jgi:hypothetical protein
LLCFVQIWVFNQSYYVTKIVGVFCAFSSQFGLYRYLCYLQANTLTCTSLLGVAIVEIICRRWAAARPLDPAVGLFFVCPRALRRGSPSDSGGTGAHMGVRARKRDW